MVWGFAALREGAVVFTCCRLAAIKRRVEDKLGLVLRLSRKWVRGGIVLEWYR